jgi:ATP-dependent Lon protease
MVIASKYLLPKICQQVNIPADQILLSDEIMRYIITEERLSRKEDGVRNLKRCLEIIHTKLNLYRVMSSNNAFFQKYKDIPKNVEFPFQLTRRDLDVLIKNNENMTPTYLTMYN